MRTAKAIALATISLLTPLAACRRPPPEGAIEPPSPAPAHTNTPVARAPVDHLAPGELVEGGQRAFGVPLPRDIRIDEAFSDSVVATGRVPVASLVKYFCARLQGGSLREGQSTATLEHAEVAGKPGLELEVRILTVPEGTRVELRDTTPVPAPRLPDEASRWKNVGLTPSGRLVDPTHLD